MASSAGILWINDKDITDFGLEILDINDVWDSVSWSRGATDMPGHAGSFPHELASLDPRDIRVTVQLEVASTTAREAALNSLDAHLSGMCELRYADQPSKIIEAMLIAGPTEAEAPSMFLDSTADLIRTLVFRMHQPVKKGRYARVVGFGSSRQEIELGTMPSSGTIRIMGAATNPTINYRAANGALVGRMGFTVTLGATEYLQIDLRRGRIDRVTAGTSASGASLLNTGDTFFRLDPGDGNFDAASWPTLDVTAGAGVIYFRKEWSS